MKTNTNTTSWARPMAGRMMEAANAPAAPNRGRVGVGAGGRLVPPALKAGTYVARCSGWVEIGTVPAFAGSSKFQVPSFKPDAPKMQRRVMLTWTIRGAAGETWRVSREFALSAGPRSGLRKLLETWRGRPYASDAEAGRTLARPERLLDQACIVTVSLVPSSKFQVSGSVPVKAWPKIESVVGLPMGVPPPEPLRWPPVRFTWAKPDRETFASLPLWIQRKVKESEEWGRAGGNAKHIPPRANTTRQ